MRLATEAVSSATRGAHPASNRSLSRGAVRIPVLLLTLALAIAFPLAGRKRQVRYFPMIALNGGAATAFLVHNPGKRAIQVRLLLRAPSGAQLIDEKVSLNPLETRRLEYAGDSGKSVGGWAELTSNRPFQATQLMLAGPSPWISVAEALPLRRFKIFGMVARAEGLQTGLALTNPSSSKTAKVQISLRDMAGKEIRRKTIELPPLANTSG